MPTPQCRLCGRDIVAPQQPRRGMCLGCWRADKAKDPPMSEFVPLAKIKLDGATQCRVEANNDAVLDYAQAYEDKRRMPPVVLFFDGTDYWIGDGWHRLLARAKLQFADIEAEVRAGTRADAMWFACAANQANALRRTNADKRKAVEQALQLHPEMSNRAIAEHCGVGHDLADRCRTEMESTARFGQSASRVGADGRTINTENIGKSYQPTQPATPQPAQADRVIPAPQDDTRPTGSTGGPDEPFVPTLGDLITLVDSAARALDSIARYRFLMVGANGIDVAGDREHTLMQQLLTEFLKSAKLWYKANTKKREDACRFF